MSALAEAVSIRRRQLLTGPLWWGVLGAAGLAAIYTAILTLSNSLDHAWRQYLFLWPWMTPLVLGFGLQIGLFRYMLGYRRLAEAKAGGTAAVAATTGISSAAMIACCLHHVTDILPVLGFSAAAAFLGAYQSLFLAIGVVSNALGIAWMLRTLQVHHLYPDRGPMARLMRLPMKPVLIATAGLGTGVLLYLAYDLFFA